MEDNQQQISPKEAKAMLWSKGILSWKLDETQKELYDAYVNETSKIITWLASRRLGKSFALCVIAVETCLKKPNSIVKFVSPEQKQVRTNIVPLIREITADCPKMIKPEFLRADSLFRFKNGSEIQMAGTDGGQHESLRGQSADLCVVDEAGFVDELGYVVRSILLPTTTTTGGKIILSSTPPRSSAHEFLEYVKKADTAGKLIKKTIFDNKRLSEKVIQEIIDEYGGVDSIEFRREFLCEIINKLDSTVIPEWTDEAEKLYVKDWTRPAYYDGYVSMDPGFRDMTGIIFAYYDFKHARLIIEDELLINGPKMTTKSLAEMIRRKEEEVFTNKLTGETQPPYLRVSDNNLILINDLQVLHRLTFMATEKDDKEAAVNNLRILIEGGRILINPRCKNLINQLKYATWNKSKKSFDRSLDSGHYDLVDALIYLARNVHFSRNPYPADWERKQSGMFSWNNKQSNPMYNAFKEMFTVNKPKNKPLDVSLFNVKQVKGK